MTALRALEKPSLSLTQYVRTDVSAAGVTSPPSQAKGHKNHMWHNE